MIKIGRRFAKSVLLANLIFWTLGAYASTTVNSTVDRNEMGMGDTLTVTVSVSSTESVEVSEPRIPNIAGFDLVNTWTASSSSSKLMQGPNGMQFETVRRQDFNYMITPQKQGTLSLPAFEVVVDGKTYTTKPIVIKVLAQGSGAAQRPQGGGSRGGGGGFPNDELDEEEAIFNQLLQQRGSQVQPSLKGLPKNQNEVLSVQVELDKTEVYEGEQIVANWYIYTRGNLLSLDRLKFPDLKGFWKEIIEEVPALNFTQEVINGIVYRKALLASHALFPIKAGTAIVDEYKIKGSVQVPSGPFGFGPTYSFNRASERIKINVKPLPLDGRPKDFSGAVGQFEVRALIEGNQFPVNQPFSLKVRFEGNGNAKLIELPALNLPAGVEVYDTKSDSKYFKNGRSFKEFEVLIIPRQEGVLKIPALSFSMFDPHTKKYTSKTTEPIEVRIIAGTSGATDKNAGSSFLDKNEKPTKAEKNTPKAPELPDVLVSWSATSTSPMIPQSALWLIVFATVVMSLVYKAQKELGGGQKKKDLKQEVLKRLAKVKSACEASDWRLVGTEMTNVFYYALGELSGQGGASLEISKLLDQAPASLRRDFGGELSRLIEIFQVLSFAPEGVVGVLREKETMKKNIEATEKVLLKAIAASDLSVGSVLNLNEAKN